MRPINGPWGSHDRVETPRNKRQALAPMATSASYKAVATILLNPTVDPKECYCQRFPLLLAPKSRVSCNPWCKGSAQRRKATRLRQGQGSRARATRPGQQARDQLGLPASCSALVATFTPRPICHRRRAPFKS